MLWFSRLVITFSVTLFLFPIPVDAEISLGLTKIKTSKLKYYRIYSSTNSNNWGFILAHWADHINEGKHKIQ